MQKLPIGIQTFKKIQEENYLYIDKTREAFELVANYSYVFLSRPRRFGKSLFLDTLKELFEGNRTLFEGLYIEEKWNWEQTYPVIKISWDGKLRSIDDLQVKARLFMRDNQKRLGIECEETVSMSGCLEELIKKAYDKYNQPVVVLIDEYDKPILDVIEETEQAKEHREYIKGLYSVLKGCDAYLKFVFLTGVSKFSRASIFSGLNMLTDISLDAPYGNICGYTQHDIETTFLPYLDGVDLEKLKVWYNGYNFLKDSVYNPFDILQFISKGKIYDSYWFVTGTPTFLIKLIEKHNYFVPKLSDLTIGKQLLDSFDVENIELENILYQSGYLTIDRMQYTPFETIEYKLRLPNKEVQISLSESIIRLLVKNSPSAIRNDLYIALQQADLEQFKTLLVSLFASIPYHHYTKNDIQHYEGFYASVVYVYLQSLGLTIIGEDVTSTGRIDLTVKMQEAIFVIEFKVGESDALAQIKARNYHQKYLTEDKDIYLIGINFDEEAKNIGAFAWERAALS